MKPMTSESGAECRGGSNCSYVATGNAGARWGVVWRARAAQG